MVTREVPLVNRSPVEYLAARASWSVLISAAVLLFAACSKQANADEVSEFDCVIEPRQIVKLASPVVGVIARLDVDRGDVIRKGQQLGKLEDGVEGANLALAKARASSDHLIRSAQARLDVLRGTSRRAGRLMAKTFGSQASAQETD